MGKTRTSRWAGGRQNERPEPELQVTKPAEWKTADQAGDLVEMPSGNVVRCIRPGMQAFVELGMVPNALIPLVDKALMEHEPPKMADVLEDESKLEATARFMTDVFMHCVKQPEVRRPPEPDEEGETPERDPDVLYTDQVELEDEAFIFQFAVGGTRSVQRFRQLQASDVADVAAESVLAGQAEQPA